MSTAPSARPRGAAWIGLLVFGAALLAYVPGAFTRGVWRVDEIRLVSVAQQMGTYDHVIVPHLNGEVYSEKPPFLYWLIIGMHTVVGDWIVAGHLVVALLAALAALVIARLGDHLSGDPRVGLVAGLAFVSLAGVVSHGRQVTFDVAVAAWVVCALWALVHAGESTGRRRAGFTGLAAAACAAACLTKGPAPLLHIALAVAAVGFVRRRHARAPWLPLGIALSIGAALTLLWVHLAAREAGSWFWDKMVLHQSTSRMQPGAYHGQPWFYYLETLPTEYLVWSTMFLGIVGALAQRAGDDLRPALTQRAVFAWGLLGTLVFSCFGAKRPGYVLPLAASFALAVGGGVLWATAATTYLRRATVLAPVGVAALLLFAAGGVALLAFVLPLSTILELVPGRHAAWLGNLTLPSRTVLGIGGVTIMAGAALVLQQVRRGHTLKAAVGLALALCVAMGATGYSLQQAQEPQQSPRSFVRDVFITLPPGVHPTLLGDEMQGRVNLYTGIEHFDVVTTDALIQSSPAARPAWLIAPDWAWFRVKLAVGSTYEVLIEREMYDRSYLLLRRR